MGSKEKVGGLHHYQTRWAAELKLAICKSLERKEASLEKLCKAYQVPSTTVREWVRLYQRGGEKVLPPKPYSRNPKPPEPAQSKVAQEQPPR